MSADVSELNQLAVHFEGASSRVDVGAYDVIKKGANNIKTMSRELISGLAHAPHYPRSITYDVNFTRHGAEAEIGPDKSRPQGALGNLLEYGSANNAPLSHLGPALDREGPNVVEHLADLAAGLVR